MERPLRLRYLLDTHVWLWRLIDPARLSVTAAEILAHREHELFLSPISVWEAMVLCRKGRLELRPNAESWIRSALAGSPVTTAPLTHEVAIRAERIEGFGIPDPADRFLVATALEEGLVLLTSDRHIRSYSSVETCW